MLVIALKDCWSQLKIFFMFSRLELMHFWQFQCQSFTFWQNHLTRCQEHQKTYQSWYHQCLSLLIREVITLQRRWYQPTFSTHLNLGLIDKSSIITLKLQQPWLLSMMLVSSSLIFCQYCIDFSFGFNFFCTITIVQRCPFSKVDFKICILSIPCSWLEAFQPLCSGHSYMSLNLDHGNLS